MELVTKKVSKNVSLKVFCKSCEIEIHVSQCHRLAFSPACCNTPNHSIYRHTPGWILNRGHSKVTQTMKILTAHSSVNRALPLKRVVGIRVSTAVSRCHVESEIYLARGVQMLTSLYVLEGIGRCVIYRRGRTLPCATEIQSGFHGVACSRVSQKLYGWVDRGYRIILQPVG